MTWRRRAATVVAVVAALLTVAPAAVALSNPFDGVDCRTPPEPRSPSTGLANDIDPGPATPRDGDAFGPNPSTTPYEKFGYGGMLYQRYDPGCLLDKLPGDVINGPGTSLANLAFTVSSGTVALAKSSDDTVRNFDETMEPLYPVIATTSDLLGEQVYYPFAALVTVGLSVWLAMQARHADTRLVGRYLAGAVLAIVTAAMLLNYPIRAVQAYTNAVNTGVEFVDEVFAGTTPGVDPGVAAHAQLHEAAVLRPYLGGLVCSSSGPTYDQYATDLYAAATLSRQEDTVSRADPDGAGQQLRGEKTGAWQALADDIEVTDPSAYDCLQGEREWEQAAFGFSSFTIAGTLGGSKIASNILLMVAFLFGALVVAFFPIIGLFGIGRTEMMVAPFAKAVKLVGLGLLVAVVVRIVARLTLGIMDEAHPLLVAGLIVGLALTGLVWKHRAKKKKQQRRADDDRDRSKDRDRPDRSKPEPETETAPEPAERSTWTTPDPQPALTRGTVVEGQPGTTVAGEVEGRQPATWVEEPARTRRQEAPAIEGRRAVEAGPTSTTGATPPTGTGAGNSTPPRAGATNGDGWVSTGPSPSSTDTDKPPVRVMDPGELLPAGVVERGYQKVYRPKKDVKDRG